MVQVIQNVDRITKKRSQLRVSTFQDPLDPQSSLLISINHDDSNQSITSTNEMKTATANTATSNKTVSNKTTSNTATSTKTPSNGTTKTKTSLQTSHQVSSLLLETAASHTRNQVGCDEYANQKEVNGNNDDNCEAMIPTKKLQPNRLVSTTSDILIPVSKPFLSMRMSQRLVKSRLDQLWALSNNTTTVHTTNSLIEHKAIQNNDNNHKNDGVDSKDVSKELQSLNAQVLYDFVPEKDSIDLIKLTANTTVKVYATDSNHTIMDKMTLDQVLESVSVGKGWCCVEYMNQKGLAPVAYLKVSHFTTP